MPSMQSTYLNSSLYISFTVFRITFSRTLINDLARFPLTLRLYAPTPGRDDLRSQIADRENITFVYPHSPSHLLSPLWRSHMIVNDLRRDNVQLYHGLSGELPIGIRKSGIKSVVTIILVAVAAALYWFYLR